jgi:hypothetical protein
VTTSTEIKTIQDYIYALQQKPAPVLPDEDQDAYLMVRHDLLMELAPNTRYQVRLAENLVYIEWEIDRHQRLLAAAVKAVTRQGVQRQLEALNGLHSNAERRSVRDLETITNSIISGDPDRRQQAAQVLESYGYSASEFVASAFRVDNTHVLYHEAKIESLFIQRRQLKADYDALRAKARPADHVIDAEVIVD